MVQYRVLKAIKDLPPRDVLIKRITADPTTIDIVSTHKALAFDFVIKNNDATTANVQVEDNLTYEIASGSSVGESDIQIGKLVISGITTGYVILHVLDIALLQKLTAVEVR